MITTIPSFATIECDNGKSYIIQPNGYGSFYNRMICRDNKVVNEVHDYYLDDCMNYDDPLCVGVKANGNLEYTRILKAFDLWGRQIK
jgi:hypothetical protein